MRFNAVELEPRYLCVALTCCAMHCATSATFSPVCQVSDRKIPSYIRTEITKLFRLISVTRRIFRPQPEATPTSARPGRKLQCGLLLRLQKTLEYLLSRPLFTTGQPEFSAVNGRR